MTGLAPASWPSPPRAPHRRPQGFTLMEVLVALALLALLMLALLGAMRSMGQTETRVDARIEANEDYRLAHALLRQTLGHASARTFRPQQADAGRDAAFFMGNTSELRWIGVMPARYGTGGRHYLRLAVEPVNGQPHWVLRYAPWHGAPTFDQWASASTQVLTATALRASLAYREPRSGQWLNAWPPAPSAATAQPSSAQPPLLPDAVRIDFDGPAPAWPPMLLAVGANYTTDPSAARASFGGSR